MSDYAGPILGVVGAIVGFVASGFNPAGAMYGFSIGPAIGASSTDARLAPKFLIQDEVA